MQRVYSVVQNMSESLDQNGSYLFSRVNTGLASRAFWSRDCGKRHFCFFSISSLFSLLSPWRKYVTRILKIFKSSIQLPDLGDLYHVTRPGSRARQSLYSLSLSAIEKIFSKYFFVRGIHDLRKHSSIEHICNSRDCPSTGHRTL